MFLRQVSYACCWIWTFSHSMFQNTFFRQTLLSGPRDNTLDKGLGSEVKFFALGQGWVSQLHWMCSSFSWENSHYLGIMIYTGNIVTTTGNVFFKLVVVTSYSSSSSSSPLSLVDGNWSAWETWSSCSKTCDNGTRTRVRSCNNPAPAHEGKDCAGEGKKSEVCLVRHCPGKRHFLTGWRRMAFQTIFTLI